MVVDAYSKWPEVRVMRSTTTQPNMEVLSDLFATHGLPRVLVIDNGPQFTAKEFSDFLKSNCIVHRTSAPYHPATNGLAENMVKNVKQWLKKQDKSSSMAVSITEFLRTYRSVPHTGTNKPPSEIMFGRTLHTRISLVLPNMLKKPDRKRPPESHHPYTRTFQVGEMVWVKEFRPTSRLLLENSNMRALVSGDSKSAGVKLNLDCSEVSEKEKQKLRNRQVW